MLGCNLWFDRGLVCRLGMAAATLMVLAAPGVAQADEAQVVRCSVEAREALARVGAWATAECDAQLLRFASLGSADPRIAELLSRSGGWTADAYLAGRAP
jgi:hypothetical protein